MSAMLATTTGQCAASKNLTLSQNLPLILYTLYISLYLYHYYLLSIHCTPVMKANPPPPRQTLLTQCS